MHLFARAYSLFPIPDLLTLKQAHVDWKSLPLELAEGLTISDDGWWTWSGVVVQHVTDWTRPSHAPRPMKDQESGKGGAPLLVPGCVVVRGPDAPPRPAFAAIAAGNKEGEQVAQSASAAAAAAEFCGGSAGVVTEGAERKEMGASNSSIVAGAQASASEQPATTSIPGVTASVSGSSDPAAAAVAVEAGYSGEGDAGFVPADCSRLSTLPGGKHGEGGQLRVERDSKMRGGNVAEGEAQGDTSKAVDAADIIGVVDQIIDWKGVPGAGRKVRWNKDGLVEDLRWGYGGCFDLNHVELNSNRTGIRKTYPLPETVEAVAARRNFGLETRRYGVILRLRSHASRFSDSTGSTNMDKPISSVETATVENTAVETGVRGLHCLGFFLLITYLAFSIISVPTPYLLSCIVRLH